MVAVLGAYVGVAPAVAQSGGLFEITRSTLDAGGSTERSPVNVAVRGTIGQPDVGAMGFGIYYLTGGFWATEGRLGIFFLDGFESADTSAWTNAVGEVVRTPEIEPEPTASTTQSDDEALASTEGKPTS